MSKQTKLRPFGFADKIGYLFGDFGNDFTFILSTLLLQKFYTDVMGVSGAVVGTIIMLARFVDAFTDVTMGRIVDRCRPRKSGKFKPWLLRMCIPVALSSFLMFQSSLADASLGFKVAYFAVTYILWGSIFYTSINIPYGSMASAISDNPDHRRSLSVFRTVGGALAAGVIGLTLPMLVYKKETTADGGTVDVLLGANATVFAAVCSVLAIGCYLICFLLVRERHLPATSVDEFKNISVGKMLASAFKNRALISIIIASVFMLLAQLTMQNMANYVYPNYYGNATAITVSSALMLIGVILAGVITPPLAKRFGKAEVSMIASFFSATIFIIVFFLKPESVWVYVGFQGLCWFGLGVFSVLAWALITDVIDFAELKNGVREDGSIYAMYSFARKLGQALAAGVSGWLLSAIGYDETKAQQGLNQDPSVLDGIFNISVLVPAVGFLALGLILWLWYPLTKNKTAEITNALAKKNSAE